MTILELQKEVLLRVTQLYENNIPCHEAETLIRIAFKEFIRHPQGIESKIGMFYCPFCMKWHDDDLIKHAVEHRKQELGL